VYRPRGPPDPVPNLRAQMAAGQSGAGLVHLEASGNLERRRDAVGDHEVRLRMARQRALRGLNQPARIANQRAGHGALVQSAQKSLHRVEAIAGLVALLIPDPQTQMLDLAQNENGVDGLRAGEAAVPARPPAPVPLLVQANDELQRIELV